MSIGKNIKTARRKKKITQIKLANAVGLSRSYISDLENGRYIPSGKVLEEIANFLGVSTYYLSTGNMTFKDAMQLEDNIKLQSLENLNQMMIEGTSQLLNSLSKTEMSYLSSTLFNNAAQFNKNASDDDLLHVSALLRNLTYYRDNLSDEEKKKTKQEYYDDLSLAMLRFLAKYFDIVDKNEKQLYNDKNRFDKQVMRYFQANKVGKDND